MADLTPDTAAGAAAPAHATVLPPEKLVVRHTGPKGPRPKAPPLAGEVRQARGPAAAAVATHLTAPTPVSLDDVGAQPVAVPTRLGTFNVLRAVRAALARDLFELAGMLTVSAPRRGLVTAPVLCGRPADAGHRPRRAAERYAQPGGEGKGGLCWRARLRVGLIHARLPARSHPLDADCSGPHVWRAVRSAGDEGAGDAPLGGARLGSRL